MKKLIYLLYVLPLMAIGQSGTQNYIRSSVYKEPTTTSDQNKAYVNVTYFDGLGRPVQQIEGKASASGKDLITHIEYDVQGRQVKEYLPYAGAAASLGFDGSALTNTLNFYSTTVFENTDNPYNEKFFEASPLNRLKKRAAPGTAWAGNAADDNDHTIKYVYLQGSAKRLSANAVWNATAKLYEPSFVSNTTYPPGELYTTRAQNENRTGAVPTGLVGYSNITDEVKNKEGQVILKRTYNTYQSGPATLDTYYVYDQFGNLTYVLPPSLNGAFDASKCYQYKYDSNNRMVEKKVPGKAWEYIVYDALDRAIAIGPVLSPFGTGEVGWVHTIYDTYGRVCVMGWYPGSVSSLLRKSKQDATSPVFNATRFNGSSSQSVDGVATDYNVSANIPSGFELLTVSYYDNYSFPGSPGQGPFANIEGQVVRSTAKGLPTGSWTRVLTTAAETLNEVGYTLYDTKGRAIRIRLANHLGGFTETSKNLDFNGKTVYSITTHRRLSGSTTITTREDFAYTPQGRLLSASHKVNSLSPQLMSYNIYNEIGQLITKYIGGTDLTGVGALQKVDFTYNIRGWLKGINSINDLALPGVPQDLFAFNINYSDTPSQAVGSPMYNGNIAETSWRTASDNIMRRYTYKYDYLNQLTAAYYQIPQSTVAMRNSYDEYLYYDLNGNIKNLGRNGDSDSSTTTIEIDDLTYTYDTVDTNKLLKVTDATNHPKGFKDSPDNSVNDYMYDAYGNMTYDRNKGITSISYNHLNLPVEIIFNGSTSQKIKYIYNAGGTRIRKTVTDGSLITTTDYLSGFQYKNAELDFFPTAEGYVEVSSSSPQGGTGPFYNYVFNYRDHLGNNRLSYTVDPADGVLKIMEENHYYPFGSRHNGYSPTQQMLTIREAAPFVQLTPVTNAADVGYKYKYNGKELQDELGLNMYDFGARNYDPAIGRWFNLDPMAEKYYTVSPYNYVLNNPVFFVDPNGKEIYIYFGQDNKEKEKYSYTKDRDYSKMDGFKADAYRALDALYGASNVNIDGKEVNLVQGLMDDKRELSVVKGGEVTGSHFAYGKSYENRKNSKTAGNDIGTIFFNNEEGVMFDDVVNPKDASYFTNQIKSGKFNKTTQINSPTSLFGHEIAHGWNFMNNKNAYYDRKDGGPVTFGPVKFPNQEEAKATSLSTQININLGENPRTNYAGIGVPTQGVTSNKLRQ